MEHIMGRLSGSILLAVGVACCAPTGMPVHGRQNYRAGPDPRHEFHPARAFNQPVGGRRHALPTGATRVAGWPSRNGLHPQWYEMEQRHWPGRGQVVSGRSRRRCLHPRSPSRSRSARLTSTRRNFGVMTKMGTRSLKCYRMGRLPDHLRLDRHLIHAVREPSTPGCGQGTNQKAATTPPNAQEICSWEDDDANPDIRSGVGHCRVGAGEPGIAAGPGCRGISPVKLTPVDGWGPPPELQHLTPDQMDLLTAQGQAAQAHHAAAAGPDRVGASPRTAAPDPRPAGPAYGTRPS